LEWIILGCIILVNLHFLRFFLHQMGSAVTSRFQTKCPNTYGKIIGLLRLKKWEKRKDPQPTDCRTQEIDPTDSNDVVATFKDSTPEHDDGGIEENEEEEEMEAINSEEVDLDIDEEKARSVSVAFVPTKQSEGVKRSFKRKCSTFSPNKSNLV